MAFDLDIMKSDLTELGNRQFYIKYIVKTMNWYFSSYMNYGEREMLEAIDHFKEIVSDKLTVSFHSAHIVGSAKVGYSLSPRKPFQPFHDKDDANTKSSDIDVAVISNILFEEFWGLLRKAYKTQLIANYKRLTSTIFQGYLNQDDIDAVDGVRNHWNELFSPITKSLQDDFDIIHPITYRVYRSWEDLEQYQISGLDKLRERICG